MIKLQKIVWTNELLEEYYSEYINFKESYKDLPNYKQIIKGYISKIKNIDNNFLKNKRRKSNGLPMKVSNDPITETMHIHLYNTKLNNKIKSLLVGLSDVTKDYGEIRCWEKYRTWSEYLAENPMSRLLEDKRRIYRRQRQNKRLLMLKRK